MITALILSLLASAPGLEHSLVPYSTFGLIRVHVLKIDPQRVQFFLARPANGAKVSTVATMDGCDKALACFNANFFTPEGHPVGIMVSQGKVLQRLRGCTGGVFWIDRQKKAHVFGCREFATQVKVDEDVDLAVQGKPLLLQHGQIVSNSGPDISRRTAIGVDRKKRVVVIVVSIPTKLATLAEFARDKLEVTDLLNLDGGRSTQLVLKGDPAAVIGLPVAVGIGVTAEVTPPSLRSTGPASP